MPFSRDSYSRLDSPKYGCDETDGLCGLQQTNQTVAEDDDLVGYSLDFAEPKDSFVGHVKQSCGNIGRKFITALHFAMKVAFGKWPIALIILICYIGLTVGLLVVALTRYDFRKDISLNSFMVPDIKVSSEFAAFNAAKKQAKPTSPYFFQAFLSTDTCTPNKIGPLPKKVHGRLKRSVEGNFQHTLAWTLDLVYVAKGGDNIFTKKRLREIHEIENTLMKHKNYNKHCYISSSISTKDEALMKYGNCTPPNSMTNYFYSRGNIYDGQSEVLSRPINETLQFLKSREYFFSYVSDDFSKKDSSNILRAQILFGRPVQGISSQPSAQKEEFKRFVRTYIDTLDELNNNNQVSILYGGGDLFDYLVDSALSSDIRLATISLGLVILLLIILTFSWWLSLMAVVTIMCSVAKAYFFYRVVFGIQYMGILNGVSLFVIIGIGVDDIFVFVNTFRQAVDNKDLGSRICHTIYVAGKATFFTSFTTAAAFGANALSPIPAIHDFGLFMSILVSSCWISVLFIMPPTLTLWHAGIEKLESAMCNRVLSAIGFRRSERLRLPNDIRTFLSGMRDGHQSEHEAIPLVSNNNDDDDDEPLLLLDNESTSNQDIQATDSIGFRLQSILYYFVAEPVIKGRVVIFIVYLVVLIGAAFLVTKLQVSTEQPKFFKADSNLQRWLELPDVSLKRPNNLLKDITDLQKHQLPKIPSIKPPITTQQKHTQTRTRKPRTPVPQRPTTKPLPTRFKSTKPKTSKMPSTHEPTVTTKKAVVTRALTTSKEETTTTSAVPTEYIEPTHTSKTTNTPRWITTNTPRWVTTSANNSSTSSCPYDCDNYSRCNTTTRQCDCYHSYTGETCSKYCPVKTMTGKCCFIPFTHEGSLRLGCLIDPDTRKPWCSLTPDYDKDGIKEECNKTVANRCAVRTETPNKTCCSFPFLYDMTEYYTCFVPAGEEESGATYCGIQPLVASSQDLVRCIFNRDTRPTIPPLCRKNDCKPVKAPPNEATALVHIVFGVKGIDKTSVDLRHVLKETEGKVVYDKVFSKYVGCHTERMINTACRICKNFSENTELVRPGGAECFPESVRLALDKFRDCRNLPKAKSTKIKSILVVKPDPERSFEMEWFAMAFSSTTATLSSYSSQRKDYEKWEAQLHDILSQKTVPESLKNGFQTSETWVKMYSGIIVVDSAVYGIVVSLLLCLGAVIIFTGHALLFIILFMTILGVLLKVIAIFYLTGWQLGGVEAISLSILVGTSVDYCFHLVEAYILAGEAVDPTLDKMAARQWRAKAAMSHIGMSIFSSAITTILAAIPLCLAQIQLFAKFGLIVTINTAISLLYTVTVTMAMLSIFGPARFRASLRACLIGLVVVGGIVGVGYLGLYLASTKGGYCIESPSGTPLLDC